MFEGKCWNDEDEDVRPNGDRPQRAPVHVTVGSAGAGTDNEDWMKKAWSLVRHKTYGFLNVEVDGGRKMRVDFWGLVEENNDPNCIPGLHERIPEERELVLMDSFELSPFAAGNDSDGLEDSSDETPNPFSAGNDSHGGESISSGDDSTSSDVDSAVYM